MLDKDNYYKWQYDTNSMLNVHIKQEHWSVYVKLQEHSSDCIKLQEHWSDYIKLQEH